MSDPIRQLKLLPWLPLFQTACIATFVATVVDFSLTLGFARIPIVTQTLTLLLAPPLGMILILGIAAGVGAIAVSLLEHRFWRIYINTAALWALVLCLMLTLILKSMFFPTLLVSADQYSLMGVVLGVFFKGKPYWR